MPAPRIALLSPSTDLLDWAARQIIDAQRASLPDLSEVTLLVPHTALLRPLRSKLLQHAGGALLGPQLQTLSAWAAAQAATPALSVLDCKLRLAEVLGKYRHLFGNQDAVALAEDFYGLFESLAVNQAEAADSERFVQRVLRAYGADLSPLSDEARMVHTLWRAWLEDTGGRSPGAAQAQRLAAGVEQRRGPLYLIGFDEFDTAEIAALRPALARAETHLWMQGRLEGRDGAALQRLCAALRVQPERVGEPSPWLDALLSEGAPLPQRLQGLARPEGLRVQTARNPEQEARLADVAIRRWLLEGKRHITVVSQDRRYARRLRALLERAGVPLRDEAGWALSTSSAASAFTHWLDCIDQGFHYRPLLALLKSEFMDPGAVQAGKVNALEAAIYQKGIVSGLNRFCAIDDDSAQFLQALSTAAEALVLHGGPRPAREWSESLRRSLEALPLWNAWTRDRAGVVLIELLQQLETSLARSGLQLSWNDFRRLLRRLLEQASFTPEALEGPVRLLTLEQVNALRCDALILAGAAAGAFPGGSPAASLFNQAVRAELGLPHWSAQQSLALARFRKLLQTAPDTLITYAPENEGEEPLPCAWVDLLMAAGVPGDPQLALLAGSSVTEVTRRETFTLAPMNAPRVTSVPDLLPESLSAAAHQALIDCPYRFHVSASLGLRAPEEPDQPYSRADFGERVHEVLSHFTAPVNAADRAATEQRMHEAAQKIFAEDLRARALARAWLAEFESLIPEIVGWLIERRNDWSAAKAEAKAELRLDEHTALHGRIDRLERNAAGALSVVDYKTGGAPRDADIESGEQVQATHYALLLENVQRVEYLVLKRKHFSATVLEGEALTAAKAGVRERVTALSDLLRRGWALPAHGDAASCEYCDYKGLCRKGAWADE